MTGSGGISASNDGMDSDYNSVIEQSGIYAGDGGFDITAGGHTQLDGAVIASTGSADKNHLDTGTLGFSDIGNKAEYSTEHQGAGISTGGSMQRTLSAIWRMAYWWAQAVKVRHQAPRKRRFQQATSPSAIPKTSSRTWLI